jgi:D-alanine-D-alanine ligase
MTGDYMEQARNDRPCTGQRVGVLMGGMSAERPVSLKTGAAILGALQRIGHDAVAIDVGRDIAGRLVSEGISVAFIALHGRLGEDGTIQGLLEVLGIPYTGSGVLASALAMNKPVAKQLFAYHGLPTPAFQCLRAGNDDAVVLASTCTLKAPVVVKPAEEGSTLGITVVQHAGDLPAAITAALCYGGELLIEDYIQGREMTAAVLNGKALPLVEIIPRSGLYDYSAKYTSGNTDYRVAPDLPPDTRDAMQTLAVQAYAALGCSGAARVDFILRDSVQPYLLEVNTIPGMTETSLLPMAARGAGIDFDRLVEHMLHSARTHAIQAPCAQ